MNDLFEFLFCPVHGVLGIVLANGLCWGIMGTKQKWVAVKQIFGRWVGFLTLVGVIFTAVAVVLLKICVMVYG